MNRPGTRPPVPAQGPIHSPASLVANLVTAGEVHGETAAWRWLRRTGHRFGHDMFPELYVRAAQAAMAPVTTGRRIAVVGTEGGGGRTTLAASLALLFASLRRDTTAALDLGDGPANLAARLGVLDPVPLHKVAQRVGAGGGRPAHLLSHATRIAPGLVTAGPGAPGSVLDSDAFGQLVGSLSGAAAITVLDTPAGLDHPGTRLALDACHAVVLVSGTTPLAVDHTHHALGRLAGRVPVLVVVNTVDAADGRRRSLPARLQDEDVEVVRLRWDRHLAAGGKLRLDHLAEKHRLDLAALGGRALDLARQGGGTWR